VKKNLSDTLRSSVHREGDFDGVRNKLKLRLKGKKLNIERKLHFREEDMSTLQTVGLAQKDT